MIIQAYFSPPFTSHRANVALLALRCLVGVAFLFHGGGKVADIGDFGEEFGIPLWLAWVAAWSQVLAGVVLIPGLLTPLAAMVLAGNMLVATAKLILRGESFINPHGHSYEASAFYFVASVLLLLLGPGAFSLDAYWTSGTQIRPAARNAHGPAQPHPHH
ncbi:MAG: DoxX family protein [Bryobacteraceae bacterium]|nr:DoxX family protein [Bryobacteraceae bacterium]